MSTLLLTGVGNATGGGQYPVVVGAVINAAGTTLTVTFNEACTGHAGFAVTPSGGASSLTYASGDPGTSYVFDLGRVIGQGETVTLAYAAGDVVAVSDSDPLQNFAGRPVTNNSVAGAPQFSSASVNSAGTTFSVTFDRPVTGNAGLSVTPSGGASTLSYSSGEGTATLVYSLSRGILSGETVTVSYTAGDIVNAADSTPLGDFTDEPVTNGSTGVAPALQSATIDTTGLLLTLVFNKAMAQGTGFTLSPSGGAATVSYASGTGTATLVYDIDRTILQGETVTLDYSPGTVEDTLNNPLGSITSFPVTNNSTQDIPTNAVRWPDNNAATWPDSNYLLWPA